MQSLVSFFRGLGIRTLNLLIAGVLLFAFVFGTAGRGTAQASRYTIDDVMDKLIEMDKRLTVVETEVKRNRELIGTVNTNLGDRISDTNTTMFWLFGFLGSLFLGILALTFATYRNTASLVRAPRARRASKEAKLLEALQKEVRELSDREKALEEKLTAARVI